MRRPALREIRLGGEIVVFRGRYGDAQSIAVREEADLFDPPAIAEEPAADGVARSCAAMMLRSRSFMERLRDVRGST